MINTIHLGILAMYLCRRYSSWRSGSAEPWQSRRWFVPRATMQLGGVLAQAPTVTERFRSNAVKSSRFTHAGTSQASTVPMQPDLMVDVDNG